MKKVLVTGGAGYIGSMLVPELVRRQYQVRVVDKCYFGETALKPVRDKIELIKADIRTVPLKIINGAEAVIHLAALSNDPMANFAPELNYSINTEASIRLARLCRQTKVKRLIFASSCSIYHRGRNNLKLNYEHSRVNPWEYYSHSKYLAEQALLSLANSNLAVVVLRKGTVAGDSPRLRFDLAVNTMVKTALTERQVVVFDGSQYRPMIDIRDVVQAYLAVLEAPVDKINRQVFNVVGKNYTMKGLGQEVVKTLTKLLKKPVPLVIKPKIKDRTYRVSARKIKAKLRFRPKFSMADSVKSLVKAVKAKLKFDFDNSIYYNIKNMIKIFPQLKESL